MVNPKKIFYLILFLLISGFAIWYFSTLFIYLITSVMLSFIGLPLVRILRRINFGKYNLPRPICAVITLIVIITILGLIVGVFIPIIVSQANVFSDIDVNTLSKSIEDMFYPLEQKLIEYKFISEDETIITLISDKVYSVIKMVNFTDIINYVLSFTGSTFIGIFAVMFTTFFFLKDEHLVYDGIMLLTPVKYHTEMQNILSSSKHLLSRYFIGLSLDIALITTCYAIGMTIFGIKNAILIAFVAGILHVIPYLGPLIGGSLGILLGIAATLASNPNADLLPVIIIITSVIVITNIIDNFVFQPLIFSNSEKAHPLEVFFIVLLGESLAGIPGMVMAIPIYTLLRVVAKEFLSKFRLVQKLTERI